MLKTMRVGICGAGPAGLTLAAILSREAEAGAFEVRVFERGEAQRDQGSGWDMSKAALEALARAGVDPSTVQRPGSDTMRFYRTGGSRPDVCLRLPSYLKRWGVKKEDVGLDQMNLETERNLIIGGLMGCGDAPPRVTPQAVDGMVPVEGATITLGPRRVPPVAGFSPTPVEGATPGGGEGARPEPSGAAADARDSRRGAAAS